MTAARIRALPCWRGDIRVEPLAGGLSNESWKVSDSNGAHVARFGEDYPFHHVDRARERRTAEAAHASGFAPKVEFAAPGVLVSRFLDARTWTAADVRAAPDRVGVLLRDFHQAMPAHVSGPAAAFWVFHILRDYVRTLAAHRPEAELAGFLAIAARLEAAQIPMPIVFGHHDLLPANILDDGQRLWLIDFEYAGFGTAMFDLASAASNAEMSDDEARELLTTYLGHAPDAAFRRAFSAMQCAALLREAMWGMVSGLHLRTAGIDFTAYATDNLDRLAVALKRHNADHGDAE